MRKILRIPQYPQFREYLSSVREVCRRYMIWFEEVRGPVSAGIDLTYKCNLNCPYCYVKKIRKSTEEMPRGMVEKLIDDLSEMQVLVLCFCGGEPTLRKDLTELIAYARDRGITPNMVTNGTLVNDRYASKLAEAGVNQVQVSLDGSKPEVHEALRGHGTFEKVLRCIKSLRDYNISTAVSFASTKTNISDFPNVVELAARLDVSSVRTMFLIPECEEHLALTPTDRDYVKLYKWIESKRFEYPLQLEFGDPTEHVVIGPYMSLLSIMVSAEGFVLPSPYVNLAFGNVFSNSLKDLWKMGLEYVFRTNKVFNTMSLLLETEKDFMRVNRTIHNFSGCNGVLDCLELEDKKKDLLADMITKALEGA